MIKKLLLLVLLCHLGSKSFLVAQDAIPINPQFTSSLVISSVLSGDQVVPEVNNSISAVAGFFVNEKRDELVVNIFTNNDSGNLTQVQIKKGTPTQNGSVVMDLTDEIDGKKISTTLTNVNKQTISNLILGNYYIEIKTDNFSGVAARGSLRLESAKSYIGLVNGSDILNQPSDSPARGAISAHYTAYLQTCEVNFFASDLSSPITAAHLLIGDEDTENGEIAFDLTDYVIGNRIFAEIDGSSFFASLARNNIHIKIYTEDYPEGEMRGQLKFTNHLVHDGWLSGSQMLPEPTNAGITGFSILVLNAGFNSCDYWIFTDGLGEDITRVSLHNASQGETSTVAYNFTNQAQGKVVIGKLVDPGLHYFSGLLLRGDIYAQIGTESYPEGKIRGQLYRVARDGHLYNFCSNQISDDIESEADGGGIIAISRKLNYSHLLFTSNNIESEVQSVTMNKGGFGEEGELVVSLTNIAQASVVNWYWDDKHSTPFDQSIANEIKTSNVFFEYATQNYPNGELRGQVLSQLNCTNRYNESADLELELEVSRVHYSQYDSLAFSFNVTNNGFATTNDVRIYAPLPNGFVYCYDIADKGEYSLFYSTWDVGSLAPGESANLKVVNLAMSSGNNINYFSQVVNSSAYDHDSTPGNDQNQTSNEDDEVATTIIALENGGSGNGDFDIDLEMDLAVDKMEVGPYQNVNYTVTVTNNGTDFANHVVSNITIPPGLAYTSHTSSKGTVQLYKGQWYIPMLAPGESATLDLELFTLWPSSSIRYFVQVHSVDEPDKDSTPGNVYDFIVSEDDEARIDITTTAHTQQSAAPMVDELYKLNKGEVYPNPTYDQINLMVQSGTEVEGTVIIYNVAGQIIHSEQNVFNQGFNEFNYDVSNFPVGTYFIQVPALEITSRFIKM